MPQEIITPPVFEIPESYRLKIPSRLLEGLDRYFNQRIRTGSFLEAVLTNDLLQAVRRADVQSFHCLHDLTDLLLMEAPAPAWGSKKKVEAWLSNRDGGV